MARLINDTDVGVTAGGSLQAAGGLLNVSSTSFRRIRAKLGVVRAGAGVVATVCVVGDSNMRGTGSGQPTGNGTDGYNGIINQIARQLTDVWKIPANAEIITGYNGYESTLATYDNRIVATGSFVGTPGSGLKGLAGQIFQASGAGTLEITPSVPCDTVDLLWLDAGGGMTYQIDGAAAVDVGVTNTSSIKRKTIALGSLASHVFKINRTSGTAYPDVFIFYTAAQSSRVDLVNCGWHGSSTNNWVTGAGGAYWNFDRQIGFLNTDLVIWGLAGTNDWGGSTSVATFIANTTTLVNKVKALASPPDILFVTAPPDGRTTGFSPNQQQYVDAFIALAPTLGVPVFDRWRRWGDQPTMEALGAMNTDHLHLTRAGAAMDANELLAAILGVAH